MPPKVTEVTKTIRNIAKQIYTIDLDRKVTMAHTLGETHHPDAVPHLARLLNRYKNEDLRCAVVEALLKIKHSSIAPHLMQLLEKDKRPYVQSHAANAFKLIGNNLQAYVVEKEHTNYFQALKLVTPHFNPLDEPCVVFYAIKWALENYTADATRASNYVKGLREKASRGELK